MATKALSVEQCQEALDVLARCGNMTSAAASMGMPRTTFYCRVQEARTRLDGEVQRTVEMAHRMNLNVEDWRSGFAVLTFRNGRLLHPELCLVHSEEAGIVEFRGEEFTV